MASDARRTRLSSEARREQLLGIGARMLDDKRLEDLSIEDIAGQAGISRGLLFHYFPSMQDFQTEVARQIMDGLVERLSRAASDDTGDDRLLSSLSVFIDFIAERPDVYRSVVRGARTGQERMRELADQTREQIVDLLLANVDPGVPSASGTDLRATRLGAHAWIAMTEELVIRWLDDAVISRGELIERITAPLPALLGRSTDSAVG